MIYSVIPFAWAVLLSASVSEPLQLPSASSGAARLISSIKQNKIVALTARQVCRLPRPLPLALASRLLLLFRGDYNGYWANV